MKFIRTIAVVTILLAFIGCDFNPAGLRLGIEVDTLAANTSLKRGQYLRLALWFGERPVDGQRPDRVFHRDENADATVGPGNPEELCLTGQELGKYDCITHILGKPGAQLWVGAFFEFVDSADQVPDPGEFLAVTGPIVLESSDQHIEGIFIRVLNPARVTLPAPESTVAEFSAAVEAGDAAAFDKLLHPFFANRWGLDYDEFSAWVRGIYAEAATDYANPLSAPLAGFMSAEVRGAFDLKGVDVTVLEFNVDVATVDVDYVLRESTVQNPIQIAERWRVETLAALDTRLVSGVDVLYQQMEGVVFTGPGLYQESKIIVDWSGSASTAKYLVGLDRFDTDQQIWEPVLADDEVTVTRCTFGLLGSCLTSVTAETDLFYRVRIAPVVDDVPGRTSTTYIAGPDYLP